MKNQSNKIIVTAPLSELNALTNVGTVDAYLVTFNANGGSGTMSDQSFNIDQTANLSTNSFTKSGYTFAGWANTASGEVIYNDEDSYTMGAENIILYAKWIVIPWVCGDRLIDTRHSSGSYSTILLGSQCWTKNNLDIGVMVPRTTAQANNSIIEKYCYDNREDLCFINGALYQWDEAMQYVATSTQGICPTGWHIPTHDEFTTLERFFCTKMGYSSNTCAATFPYDMTTQGDLGTTEGNSMKSYSLWAALLAGYFKSSTNAFVSVGSVTYFWSSSSSATFTAFNRKLSSNITKVIRTIDYKSNGFSVRCLKD